MRRWGLMACLLCLAASAVAAQEPPAAKVEVVSGDVQVVDPARTARTVAVGDAVREGESIVTGADGELHLEMADGGSIAVRPNTRLAIAAYRARGDDQDRSVFSLLAGGFRSITGWIGRFNPRAYQIRTPTATIGVRGTDHEPWVIPEGSSEGEPGTYDKVNIGASYIETAEGTVEVPEQRVAFAPLAGPVRRPRLLEGVPRMFRPGLHEHLLERRHEAIQHLLERRRFERRQFFEQRLPAAGQFREHRAEVRQRRAEAVERRRDLAEHRRPPRPEARPQPRGERPAGQRPHRLTPPGR